MNLLVSGGYGSHGTYKIFGLSNGGKSELSIHCTVKSISETESTEELVTNRPATSRATEATTQEPNSDLDSGMA